MCRIRHGILILELCLLLRMRKLLYFFFKWMRPVLKILLLMALGAGNLIYYFFNKILVGLKKNIKLKFIHL